MLFCCDDAGTLTFVSKLDLPKQSIQRNISAMERFRNMDKRATTEDRNTALDTLHQNSITYGDPPSLPLFNFPHQNMCISKWGHAWCTNTLSLCGFYYVQPSVYLWGGQEGMSQVLHDWHWRSDDHLGLQGRQTRTTRSLLCFSYWSQAQTKCFVLFCVVCLPSQSLEASIQGLCIMWMNSPQCCRLTSTTTTTTTTTTPAPSLPHPAVSHDASGTKHTYTRLFTNMSVCRSTDKTPPPPYHMRISFMWHVTSLFLFVLNEG